MCILRYLPEEFAIGADDRRGVVIEAGGASFEERRDDDCPGLARDGAQRSGRGPRDFFRQREVGVVLRLAKILRPEKLRQTNDLPPLFGRFAHARDRFGEVSLGLRAALHLHQCDPCRAFESPAVASHPLRGTAEFLSRILPCLTTKRRRS